MCGLAGEVAFHGARADVGVVALLRPQYVAGLLARPNDERTRTSANSLWVLAVLELWLQRHGVG